MRMRQVLSNDETYPAVDMLPSTVVVEETQHGRDEPERDDVERAGRAHVRKLYTNPVKSKIRDMQSNGASGAISGKESKPRLNFGEHRKDILACFDFRSNRILNLYKPGLYGSPDEFNEAVKAIKDPNLKRTISQLEHEKKMDAKENPAVVGVKQVYDLVTKDPHDSLSFFYKHTTTPHRYGMTPMNRHAYLQWMDIYHEFSHDLRP
ncbi:hypothetical protein FAUST_4229 [Fusarium austroamericanum]|uniref:Uncharacterized protein n=1 Tax=Fusarium austroamericanum TaxID=282268 RepID=A0AAN6C3F8_FUSAU|nr:hypothetical protein FAUST_4229 [Fusarium austroamericanum]